MRTVLACRALWLAAALLGALAAPAQAGIITNGGFEAAFTACMRLDQIGSDGTFCLQTGTTRPVNGLPVPPPPEGTTAAMTDAQGPGSHVLFQDFVVPLAPGPYQASFALFLNSDAAFRNPASLDFSTPTLNQQARVDILTTAANPFSVAAADVLQNLFQTIPGDPQVSGYTNRVADVSALFQAHQGQTLRLRFAEVDNVSVFNLGVDNVAIKAVPEPSSLALVGAALLPLLYAARKRRRKTNAE